MDKKKKNLIRIIVTAALFAAALLLTHFVSIPWWGELIIFLAVYAPIAYDVVYKAVRGIFHGQVLDENFLMLIATAGAFAVREYPEAILVMWLYQIGELFQSFAVGKSRKSIASLMDIRPDTARVLVGGKEEIKPCEEVVIGDLISVFPGERVPVDGVITEGATALDTAALTGESVPKKAKVGDAALSGCINMTAPVTIRCEKEFYDSTASKILELVENASSKKAKAENFITKFAKYYTPVVVIAAVLLAVIPSLFTGEWSVWVYRALSFLVASCPCALVISVPLSFFGGIGGASAEGVLVKGGNYLELLSKTDVFVMDKTGTITKGEFEVQRVYPEEKRNEILSVASIAERASTHPVALSVMRAAASAGVSVSGGDFTIEEIAGKGVKSVSGGRVIYAGNARLMEDAGIDYAPANDVGSVVYVAENGGFVGGIIIADGIKESSREAIAALKADGAAVYMLTGDNERTAAQIAKSVGADGYKAQLLPADKVAELEKIIAEKKKGSVVAFVGDGINDAPVLTRADVGIAMGALGSDSAIEAADVVLMHDDLSHIPVAKKSAKKTMRIVLQNIVFALIVKAAVLALSAFGITDMWVAIFADVGVMVLAVLNAMRCIKRVSKAPEGKRRGSSVQESSLS